MRTPDRDQIITVTGARLHSAGRGGVKRKQDILLFLFVALSAVGLPGCDPDATYTVVYIVRHAEVDYSSGDTDPPLTTEGQARAQALRDQLTTSTLAAVYQTEKKRTRETAALVAADHGLQATEMSDGQNQTLVDHVLANHAGEAVLIVNHSHNILEIIEAFGADLPFGVYPTDEFDKFFILIHSELDGTTSAGVFVSEYGTASPTP